MEITPLENPLGVESITDLIRLISNSLIEIALPIAAILYVVAGVLYLTAGDNTNRLARAKAILQWTTLGLVIILIGGGFVDLLRSILNLGQ